MSMSPETQQFTEVEPEAANQIAADSLVTDALTDEQEEESGEESRVVDLITGETISLSDPKERIRQDEERKLLEEFGYPELVKRDLIRLNLQLRPQQGKSRRLPLVVLRPDAATQPT